MVPKINVKVDNRIIKMTPIESAFWEEAKGKIPGLKAQYNIGKYWVDFFIPKKGIVIELDGHPYHKTKEQRTYDANRERYLEKQGYQVIRFTGTEIFNDVKSAVKDALQISIVPSQDGSRKDHRFICYSFQRVIERIAAQKNLDIYSNNFYAKFRLSSPLHLPLTIQSLDNGDTIAVSHIKIINGEVAWDPMIEFHVIKKNNGVRWFPKEMTQSLFCRYTIFSTRKDDGISICDGVNLSDIYSFIEDHWARSLTIDKWEKESILVEENINQGSLF